MAESTLSITRSDIKQELARYLGITLTASDQATHDSSAITFAIEEGERDFYNAYAWPFLRPIGLFHLDASDADYDLPDDFGGFIERELHYSRGDNAWHSLKQTSVANILKHRGESPLETLAFPTLYAETWLEAGNSRGQRRTLIVWPAPSATITVRGQYISIPNAISDSAPYPLGGQQHSGTLLAACLAAAERIQDGAEGVWAATYQRRLADSLRIVQETAPKFLGSLRGNSRSCGAGRHDLSNHYVSYSNQFYLGAD